MSTLNAHARNMFESEVLSDLALPLSAAWLEGGDQPSCWLFAACTLGRLSVCFYVILTSWPNRASVATMQTTLGGRCGEGASKDRQQVLGPEHGRR